MRVTISEELAGLLLEIFRDALEAGCQFDQDILNDYDKFRDSVRIAKGRKKIKRKED